METRLIDVAKNDPRYYEMFVSYKPDKRKTILNNVWTGWKEDQEFHTEDDIVYHPIVIDDELYIIAHEATEQRIRLYGLRAYDLFEQTLEKIAGLYSSQELRTTGVPLTGYINKNLPGFLRETAKRDYWIDSSFRYRYVCPGYYVLYAISSEVGEICLFHTRGRGRADGRACAVRPVIHLPSDILVERDDSIHNGLTPETGWKLKLPEERKENVIKYIRTCTFDPLYRYEDTTS